MLSEVKVHVSCKYCSPEPQGWPEWKSQFHVFPRSQWIDKQKWRGTSLQHGTRSRKKFSVWFDWCRSKWLPDSARQVQWELWTKKECHSWKSYLPQKKSERGESVEDYIRLSHELSEYANFEDRESTIRDRLVLGLLDQELTEMLQLESELTLAKAT